MKRITAAITAGSIGVVGFGLAVPALASAASSPSTTSKLTAAQTKSIEDFLADHPQLAQALAGRAAQWQKLITAHPEIQAELTKLMAMPADQRKAELKKWLDANPAAKQALQDYRQGIKTTRLTKQRDRIDQRLKRLSGENGASSGSSSGSSSGAGSGSAKPSSSSLSPSSFGGLST